MRLDYETRLLDGMLEAVARHLTPELARELAGMRADPAAQERMDELADKCNEGLLSPEERAEYEAYVSVANLLAVLQSKARNFLATNSAA